MPFHFRQTVPTPQRDHTTNSSPWILRDHKAVRAYQITSPAKCSLFHPSKVSLLHAHHSAHMRCRWPDLPCRPVPVAERYRPGVLHGNGNVLPAPPETPASRQLKSSPNFNKISVGNVVPMIFTSSKLIMAYRLSLFSHHGSSNLPWVQFTCTDLETGQKDFRIKTTPACFSTVQEWFSQNVSVISAARHSQKGTASAF